MLTQPTIDQFHEDGVTVLRGLVDESWLQRLAEGVETNMRAPGPYGKNHTEQGRPGSYFGDYVNWQRSQPDNYDGIQHCVIVAVESGEWFDRHCPNQLHQFVDSFACADADF